MNKYKRLSVFILMLFLMAFQCEEDLEPQFAFNKYKVAISPEASFSINDTIWIKGRISSYALDLNTNDSIFGIEPPSDSFGVFKLMTPADASNCRDALDKFELIFSTGDFSFISACENADLIALPELEADESFYSYRIGLKAMHPGDYVISLQDGNLLNTNRNEYLIEDYPLVNYPGQIGFNRCGSVSWRFLAASDAEYFFRVE
jgi:hypothetical protein